MRVPVAERGDFSRLRMYRLLLGFNRIGHLYIVPPVMLFAALSYYLKGSVAILAGSSQSFTSCRELLTEVAMKLK